MMWNRMLFLMMVFFFLVCQKINAEETDQFTLPPSALQDIGPIASHHLYDVLERVRTQTNNEIRMYQARAAQSRHAAAQLALRQQGAYLADLLYKNTGPGIPRWLRFNRLPKGPKPNFYKERLPWKTAYWLVFSQSPLFVIGLAPTINMYGYYFGTDKLGHFFMMGHTYYKIYNYLRAHGRSAQAAHTAIVTYGQILEQTYLGTLINGVYSNADLSGNYAGWKFYTNLAQPIKIGQRTLPPILVLRDGYWQFSPHVVPAKLLKPYLSEHLNEAWNPCRYSFSRGQLRRQIKKRCNEWVNRKGLTLQKVKEQQAKTKTWYGEEYGHWLPASTAVTLELCFA